MSQASVEDVLDFWFADAMSSASTLEARTATWFRRDEAFDRKIARRFSDLPDAGLSGALDSWADTPRGALAFVVALDQFPRNLHRGSASAFAYDARALDVALRAIESGADGQLHAAEATFLYLPLEHAEDLAMQRRCVALFQALTARAPVAMRESFLGFETFAQRHCNVIERFGRFPHRNEVLGRPSTPEESTYLASDGETFGG